MVRLTIDKMKESKVDEVVLETEITNEAALRLYECKLFILKRIAFGFVRDKRLLSYYLNCNDAFKLKLFIN